MTANQSPGSNGSRKIGITRFGVFQFHWEADSLRRDGKDLSIQPQPLALLKLFLRRPGEMVTREEIHNALWQGRVVELDQSLNFCMRKLRETLGDASATLPLFHVAGTIFSGSGL